MELKLSRDWFERNIESDDAFEVDAGRPVLEERFEKFRSEYIKFDRIENPRSHRPDMHAFMLLDELFPGSHDMVSAAEHDQFWLDIEYKDIEKLTDEQICELVRCGVMFDEDSLSMFA